MSDPLILASGSSIRADLLRQADVPFDVERPRVDETAIKISLLSEGVSPRNIADTLAEAKARRIAGKHPTRLVLGCDQVLDFEGELLSKPESPNDALVQLKAMSGRRHSLFSAAVIFEDNEPVWRYIGEVRLFMREASEAYIEDYVARNWESIRHSVGCYRLEEEGVRLIHRIDGDYFSVLGLPLLEVLSYLTLRGNLPG